MLLVGPNGAGKTNLIEAISLLTPGRGLRRATLEDVAFAEGDGAWAVAAEVEGALGLATLGTGIEPPVGEDAPHSRKCRIDREPVASATAFVDHLRVIWLIPAMDGLFDGPASERRRFLDTDPVRHHHAFELHFTTDRFQFARHVVNRFGGLRRAAQARSNVVRQMRNLSICIITAQRRLLQPFQIRERLRRKNDRRCCWSWRAV